MEKEKIQKFVETETITHSAMILEKLKELGITKGSVLITGEWKGSEFICRHGIVDGKMDYGSFSYGDLEDASFGNPGNYCEPDTE